MTKERATNDQPCHIAKGGGGQAKAPQKGQGSGENESGHKIEDGGIDVGVHELADMARGEPMPCHEHRAKEGE